MRTPTCSVKLSTSRRLKPVLRESDFDTFDLDRAFKVVTEMANRLSD